MSLGFFETKPRAFNPVAASGLTKEVLEGANAALKALATWRNEIADTNQKNGERVLDQMAVAAKTLGWPAQVVDAARTQLKSVAEIQVKTMDQMMDVLEEQLKLPNPMSASPSALLSKLKSFPAFGSAGSWPGADAFQMAAINPLRFWTQFAEQWQKSWAETMTAWTKAGKPH